MREHPFAVTTSSEEQFKKVHPVSFRADDYLYKKMQKWLKKNAVMNQAQLITLAIDKYISEPQTLEPVYEDEEDEFMLRRRRVGRKYN